MKTVTIETECNINKNEVYGVPLNVLKDINSKSIKRHYNRTLDWKEFLTYLNLICEENNLVFSEDMSVPIRPLLVHKQFCHDKWDPNAFVYTVRCEVIDGILDIHPSMFFNIVNTNTMTKPTINTLSQ